MMLRSLLKTMETHCCLLLGSEQPSWIYWNWLALFLRQGMLLFYRNWQLARESKSFLNAKITKNMSTYTHSYLHTHTNTHLCVCVCVSAMQVKCLYLVSPPLLEQLLIVVLQMKCMPISISFFFAIFPTKLFFPHVPVIIFGVQKNLQSPARCRHVCRRCGIHLWQSEPMKPAVTAALTAVSMFFLGEVRSPWRPIADELARGAKKFHAAHVCRKQRLKHFGPVPNICRCAWSCGRNRARGFDSMVRFPPRSCHTNYTH